MGYFPVPFVHMLLRYGLDAGNKSFLLSLSDAPRLASRRRTWPWLGIVSIFIAR